MKQAVAFFIAIAALASAVHAGELVLKNGDRLAGSVVRLDGENLVWKSNTVGQVWIKKSEVDSIIAIEPYKLDGHGEPCWITSMTDGQMRFTCDDGAVGRVALTSLRQLLPYPVYAEGYYTYRGKLLISGRQSSGNNDEASWAVDTETLYRRGDFRHESSVEFDKISLRDQPADGILDVRYSLDWFFQEKWYWYNEIQAGYNEARDIDESYIYGSGFGFQVWETDISALSVESGVSYLKENLARPPVVRPEFEPTKETSAWRWAANYRRTLPRNIRFFHRHQLIRSLTDPSDWTLEADTGFSMPLSGVLHAEIRMDYDVDNLPTGNKRREDTRLSVGVGYSW